jgi:hypothetical protein
LEPSPAAPGRPNCLDRSDLAVGVNSDGRRAVLGLDIGRSETGKLARRRLRGVKL